MQAFPYPDAPRNNYKPESSDYRYKIRVLHRTAKGRECFHAHDGHYGRRD